MNTEQQEDNQEDILPVYRRAKTLYPFIGVLVFLIIVSIVIFLLVLWSRFQNKLQQNPVAAEQVDMDQMLGTWYVKANLPTDADKDAINYTMSFSKVDKNNLQMITQCEVGHRFQKKSKAERLRSGVFAMKVNKYSKMTTDQQSGDDLVLPAKFDVTFFKSKELWVLDKDEYYTWMVIGSPKGKYLWILSRNPELPSGVYHQILRRLKPYDKTYNLTKLQSIFHKDKNDTKKTFINTLN